LYGALTLETTPGYLSRVGRAPAKLKAHVAAGLILSNPRLVLRTGFVYERHKWVILREGRKPRICENTIVLTCRCKGRRPNLPGCLNRQQAATPLDPAGMRRTAHLKNPLLADAAHE
jgi:hypothetical protein